MDVIANDNINDSICIGNDNNDYTTQALVRIDFKKFDIVLLVPKWNR